MSKSLETDHDGELPSLKLSLMRTGLFAGDIYREVIEKELARKDARIEQLEKEVERLRQQTQGYVESFLADTQFDSTAQDRADKELSGDDSER